MWESAEFSPEEYDKERWVWPSQQFPEIEGDEKRSIPVKPIGPNYYEVLGVTHTASQQEIREAYLELALWTHPEKVEVTKKAAAIAEFQLLATAYHVLHNVERRDRYDAEGRAYKAVVDALSIYGHVVRLKRICKDCEHSSRMAIPQEEWPTDDYGSLAKIHTDVKRQGKGIYWNIKGKHIRSARDKVDADTVEPISKKQRKVAIVKETNDMADAFWEIIKGGTLLDVFSRSRHRYNVEGPEADALLKKFDAYMEDPGNNELLQELEELEAWVYDEVDFRAWGGALHNNIPGQSRLLVYELCQAKVSPTERCGTLMPSVYWAQPDKAKWNFFCSCQWPEVCSQGEDGKNIARIMEKHWGTNMSKWPGTNARRTDGRLFGGKSIVCGAKFMPFRRGASQVVMLQSKDDSRIVHFSLLGPFLNPVVVETVVF